MDAINSKAATAYVSALNRAAGMPAGAAEISSNGGGFSDMLKDAISGAEEAGKAGESASLAAVAKQAEMVDVVSAMTKAEITLEAVVAVRDRVIQAYNDIIKMPI